MACRELSTQAWQVAPTESLWSILRRYLAIDRPNIRNATETIGKRPGYCDDGHWLLYRLHLEPVGFAHLHEALGLSEEQAFMATLPIPPLTSEWNDVIRFCPKCQERGLHFSVFQIPWSDYCPIHGERLRQTCPKCGATTRAIWGSHFVMSPYLCNACFTCIGNPLETAKRPLEPTQCAQLMDLWRDYLKSYAKLKAYAFPRTTQVMAYTDIMALARNAERGSVFLEDNVLVEKVYEARSTEKNWSQQCDQFVNLDKQFDEHDRQSALVALWKSFRRNLEKGIQGKYRRYINIEKMGFLSVGELEDVGDAFSAFLAWRVFWRDTAGLSRKPCVYRIMSSAQQKSGEWIGNNSPSAGYWTDSLPLVVRRYNEQFHYVARQGRSGPKARRYKNAMSGQGFSQWAAQHAFAAHLIARRDQARAMANALLMYKFAWPYTLFRSLDHLTGITMIVNDNSAGAVTISAWRPSKVNLDLDYVCRHVVHDAQKRRVEAKLAADSLRS